MSSAGNYCSRCKARGHTIQNCPRNQGQIRTQGAEQQQQQQQQPRHSRPHQRERTHGHSQGRAQEFMLPLPQQQMYMPPPYQQMYMPPPHQQMYMPPPYQQSVIAQGPELFPVQRVDTLQDNTDISLLPDFWKLFGIDNTRELAQEVLTTAKINQRARPDRRKFPLVTKLFKEQETPQQSSDMFVCFTAVGILSKLLERKCKIILKGKTGLFLCADILGKSGDLEGVTTDDIDLLILAKQTGNLDQSRKIFAQQVGAFITLCLRTNPRNEELAKRGEAPPIHKCSDVIIRGDGICGTSLESKNVKVTLDLGDGRKLKLVDITYTTYHKDIDRFYTRFSKADVSLTECYFYLDVKVSIMEYVFIILENVRKCSEHVKKTGDTAAKLEEFLPRSTKEKEQKLRSQQLLAERRGAPHAASGIFPGAADFMDNLTDFEQSTMFKFSKSALLCASLIAESPEYDSEGLDQEEKWALQKRIVLMQLYELSRHGIIPRKFTRVMVQTQDVLEEMLADVILQKREADRFKGAKMHKHTAERLKAIEVLNSEWPITSFETHRFKRVPMGVAVEEFDVRQMVDNPLLTPRGLLPSSEEDETDIGAEAVAASADLREERRRRKNKHRFNKTAAKLVLQKRGALQTRRQHRAEGEGEGEGEVETLPRLIELRSDSSGVSSDHYFSPRSSISTDESVHTMHTPGEGTPKDLSPRQGGRRSSSGKRRHRRRKSRKRYTTTIRRK
jgi:hypothetical protein